MLIAGLGGIYTELFGMVSLRLLPVDSFEIETILSEIKGLEKLLTGYRGQPPLDREALIAAIGQLSRLVSSKSDHIELLEINPLRVLPAGQGVCALDCVMELTDKKGAV
ncbi:hypothetical protein SDC9_203642 [bioreactor metagenome]|uniref:ATP-grasp domain-containing protein n=1 Tax=bioreactor metagenome TaxID=1076179 RepID=A0A645IX24_9ZZZZ